MIKLKPLISEAGYADDFSKSINALNAEAGGLYPASVLGKKLGVNPKAIRALMFPSEWHHSSKFYNPVDYYSEEQALEIIDKLKAWREPIKNVEVFDDVSGSYLVWSGTRNHPKATEIKFQNAKAYKKGTWYLLELPDGTKVKKGEKTRGFHLYDKNGKSLTFNVRESIQENLAINNELKLKKGLEKLLQAFVADGTIGSYNRGLSSGKMNAGDFIGDFTNKILGALRGQIKTVNDRGNWENQPMDTTHTPVVTCPKCKAAFNYNEQPEVAMGAIKCPFCNVTLNQDGDAV